jgi:hypothetical protein
MMSPLFEELPPERGAGPTVKPRRVVFTHRCLYCPKYFNTFSYAAWHMYDCHRRAMAARGMTYPVLLRFEERFVVFMDRAPKKKGYLR